MDIQQKDNEAIAAYIHYFKTAAKWCALKVLEMHPPSQLKYMRRTPKLWLKLSAVHQLTAMLTPSTVSMMSGDDRCFVCGQTGHFGWHCPDARCNRCDKFGHFVQDCPNKILQSGTPYHQDRSPSRHWYTDNKRDRSHSYYGPRHRTHFSRPQSHHCSHCNRSSSFGRHTLHSFSSYHSSSCYPLADRCSHHPSHCDINRS